MSPPSNKKKKGGMKDEVEGRIKLREAIKIAEEEYAKMEEKIRTMEEAMRKVDEDHREDKKKLETELKKRDVELKKVEAKFEKQLEREKKGMLEEFEKEKAKLAEDHAKVVETTTANAIESTRVCIARYCLAVVQQAADAGYDTSIWNLEDWEKTVEEDDEKNRLKDLEEGENAEGGSRVDDAGDKQAEFVSEDILKEIQADEAATVDGGDSKEE